MYITYTYICKKLIYTVRLYRVVGLPKRIKLRKYAKLNFPLPTPTSYPSLLRHTHATRTYMHTCACLQVCWRKWNRFKHRRVRTRESHTQKHIYPACKYPVDSGAWTILPLPALPVLFYPINNCLFKRRKCQHSQTLQRRRTIQFRSGQWQQQLPCLLLHLCPVPTSCAPCVLHLSIDIITYLTSQLLSHPTHVGLTTCFVFAGGEHRLNK